MQVRQETLARDYTEARIDQHGDGDGRADEAMRHKQVRTQTIASKCSGRARSILVK
jgi:hypothetical protein